MVISEPEPGRLAVSSRSDLLLGTTVAGLFGAFLSALAVREALTAPTMVGGPSQAPFAAIFGATALFGAWKGLHALNDWLAGDHCVFDKVLHRVILRGRTLCSLEELAAIELQELKGSDRSEWRLILVLGDGRRAPLREDEHGPGVRRAAERVAAFAGVELREAPSTSR